MRKYENTGVISRGGEAGVVYSKASVHSEKWCCIVIIQEWFKSRHIHNDRARVRECIRKEISAYRRFTRDEKFLAGNAGLNGDAEW